MPARRGAGRLVVIALVLAAPLVVLGCGKDGPIEPEPAKPFVYSDRSTPDNTLFRMTQAVSRRDSVVTASVYADDYQGSSTDMTDPNPTTLQFNKTDEVRAVAGMASSSTITAIVMDLFPNTTWFHTHYVADPVGWITIQVPYYTIYVNDIVAGEYETRSPASGRTSVFEFTLKPTTPDATSPTDTTWTIVRWKEVVDNT